MDATNHSISLPELANRIRRALKRSAKHIDDHIEIGRCLAEARNKFRSNVEFGHWLIDNDIAFNRTDRAAYIEIGLADPGEVRQMATARFDKSLIRGLADILKARNKESSPVVNSLERPDPIAQLADLRSMAGENLDPVSAEEPADERLPEEAPPEPIEPPALPAPAAEPPKRYPVPASSKLRDAIGAEIADPLLARFRNANRMFLTPQTLGNPKSNPHNKRALMLHLALRCQVPDYPVELFEQTTYSHQMIYPHVPKRLLDMVFGSVGMPSLYKDHKAMVETEQRFMASPAFGVTDPPLAAFNKAREIFQAVQNAKAGISINPTAVHRPSYEGDEGKPPVIIRGTQLWPAETGAGYCYDDLRCAYGFVEDVLKTFKEPADSPMTTQSLKLRHLMSWFEEGYNSVGSTTAGFLKALPRVVQAYSSNRSEEMAPPMVRMQKTDGGRS